MLVSTQILSIQILSAVRVDINLTRLTRFVSTCIHFKHMDSGISVTLCYPDFLLRVKHLIHI